MYPYSILKVKYECSDCSVNIAHSIIVSVSLKLPQIPGLALGLGAIVHGLSVCGHGKAEDLNNRLLPAWIKILLAEVCANYVV